MIKGNQLQKDLEKMFKSMDEFKYENYGKALWCMLRNQTHDLFVDVLICDFDYNYHDLMEIDLEDIVQDTIENVVIPKLTGLDDADSVNKFEEILDSLEEKFNEEEDIEDDKKEEPKYDSIRIDIEMYRNSDGSYSMWIADQIGGSSLKVEDGKTPEECAKNAVPYLEDYLHQLAKP